jgi:exopolysaccharide production protein ExoQ
MVIWLIFKASSSTALVCLLLGVCILLLIRYPIVKKQVRYLGTYTLALIFFMLIVYSFRGILETLVELVGRDLTLTGRTDIWADVLKEPINPLLGTGYQSFWLGSGGVHMWEKYYFQPVQAHNGYLETYLNCGLIGLSLLIAMIIYTGNKLKKELLLGSSFGALLFSFFVAAIFYNWTEAMFGGLNLIWIILCIAALHYPFPNETIPGNFVRSARGIQNTSSV